ncbi:MAG: energy-coupling factor ABC transporter permease [bacterium]|jgi:cobalt/nickel transport system permease protein
MTHLHIPDGVLSGLWLVAGYAISGVLLAYALHRNRGIAGNEMLPRIGVVAAVMLLAMSIPVGVLPIHLNLTVLGGILLGPWLAFIAVFLVNLFLALIGHGGITVLGWNTFLLGMEAMVGGGLFKFFAKRLNVVAAATGATILAVTLSLLLLVGLVGMMQFEPALLIPHNHVVEEQEQGGHQEVGFQEPGHIHDEIGSFSLNRFLILVLPLGLLGIGLETFAIALVIGFFLRVRPDLF